MSCHDFQPNTREEALAQELAARLGDPDGLPVYMKIATRYPESVIRQMLGRALAVPQDRIRTSRGALFTWLMHHYGTRSYPEHPTPHSGQ